MSYARNERVIAGGVRGSPAKLYFTKSTRMEDMPVSCTLAEFAKSAVKHFLN